MGFTLGPNTRLPDSSVPSLLSNPGRPTRPGPPTATMGGGEGKSKKRRSSTSSGTQSPRDTYRIPYLVESVGSFCCGPSISFFLGLAEEEGGERKRRDKKESKRRSRDDREDDDDRHKKKGKHIDRNKGKGWVPKSLQLPVL